MLGAIAHDIKTYIQRLKLRLDLLDDPAQVEKAARDLDAMNTFVEDALLLAVHANPLTVKETVDVSSVAAHEVEAARMSGGTITLEGDGGPLLVTGDPTSLSRALANVIGNALRYGKEAHLALRQSPRAIEIIVDDKGPGIPAAQRQADSPPSIAATPRAAGIPAARASAGHNLGYRRAARRFDRNRRGARRRREGDDHIAAGRSRKPGLTRLTVSERTPPSLARRPRRRSRCSCRDCLRRTMRAGRPRPASARGSSGRRNPAGFVGSLAGLRFPTRDRPAAAGSRAAASAPESAPSWPGGPSNPRRRGRRSCGTRNRSKFAARAVRWPPPRIAANAEGTSPAAPYGKPRMHADGLEDIGIGRGENIRHRAAGGQAGRECPLPPEAEFMGEALREARQPGGLAGAAVLMAPVEPIPASRRVRSARLERIGDDEAEFVRQPIHSRAYREIVGVLRAAMQHQHDHRPVSAQGRREHRACSSTRQLRCDRPET